MKKSILALHFLIVLVLNSAVAQSVSDSLRIEELIKRSEELRYIHTDSAILWMKEAHRLATTNDLAAQTAKALYLIGVGFHVKGELDSAEHYYSQSLPKLVLSNDSTGLSSVTNNLGLIKLNRGDNSSAIEFILRSATIDERLGDKAAFASSLNNIGLIYRQIHDNENALRFYRRAEKIQTELEDDFRLVQLYNNMGLIKEEQGEVDSASFFYRKSLEKAYAPESQNHRANPLIGMGQLFFNTGQLDSAYLYAQEAVAVSTQTQQPKTLSVAKLLIGQVELRKGRLGAAERHLTAAYQLALESDLKPEIEQAALRFHELYKRRGDYKKALEYFELYEKTKTELLNEANIREVTKHEERYKSEKERQQLRIEQNEATLKLEKEKFQAQIQQRNTLIALTLIVLITIGITFSLYNKKKTGQKLEALNHDLFLKNNKLNRLDEFRTRFLANINHDFRTPLTLIKGRTEQIIGDERSYLTKKSEKHLQQILENAETLHHMSEEIQNLGKIEESQLEVQWQAVNLSAFTHAIVELFSSRADMEVKYLKFENKTAGKDLIHLDKRHYQRILNNLLSNAFKFTRQGDTITVSVEGEEHHALITVNDTGMGIKEGDQPYIFDRFYQSSANPYSEKEGFGIGLTLVRELIGLHGGSISVESHEGTGTTFTFSLPYHLDQVISEEQAAISNVPDDKQIVQPVYQNVDLDESDRPEILVVEDHQAVRDYIIDVIGSDFKVKEASHGKQALEILQKGIPDLIITDLMMPWMDGFELIEALEQNTEYSKIPIMVVSARTSDEDKMRVLELGVNDFLNKPFNVQEFHKRIKNLISKTSHSGSWEYITKDNNLKTDVEKDILSKIHNLVVARISDPNLTVDVLADALCASTRKTHTLIKNLTGKPPKTYIKTIRLEYVQHLIQNSKVSTLLEAAQAIGMKNGTEFKTQYQRQFGKEPFTR
ncbi:MAG: response regulator [Reichenbachiella sp.]|uniref:response regulator n=1 Tax=Reichenbachiella sp. TaxID=2184521 RepID=UPI003265714B